MAVTARTSDLCCAQIQRVLDDMSPNTKPSNRPYDGGMLAALKSPQNVGGFSVHDPTKDGKGRPQAANACIVELEYEAPFCAAVSDGILDICGALTADSDSRLYLQVTIDEQKSVGGTYSEDDFACLCESPDQRLVKRIQQGAENLRFAINNDLAELAYAQVGSYTNGAASNAPGEVVNILNPNGWANPAAMIKISNEHRRQDCNSAPIIVGGIYLETWMKARSVSGLNGNDPNAPGDPSFGASMYVDIHADAAIQDLAGDSLNHALSWCPGAFQLLEWWENTGYMEKFHDHYTFTTLTIDGIKYDFYLRYQECARQWSWVLGKSYDLFCLPEALYAPCIVGNHKMHWLLDCAAPTCADYDIQVAAT